MADDEEPTERRMLRPLSRQMADKMRRGDKLCTNKREARS